MADKETDKGAHPAPQQAPKETKPDDNHPVYRDYASI